MGIIRVSNKINTYNVDESNLHKAEADGYTPVVSVSNGAQAHDVHPEDLHLALADGYKPTSQMPGMGKSALMGAEQGLLLGGADEAGGLIQAGLDAGQSGLHRIFPSMVGASPTQTNAALAAAGTTGDVGPTNEAQMYRQAQQENEKDYDIAQKANPGSYLGGTLAGGLLGMKGLGMAKLAPELIAAEKGAPGLRAILAEKGLTPAVMEALKRGTIATVNAAPIGAAYGALDSKGTIENDPTKILKDTARGAVTAGGVGLGLNLASEVGAPLAGAAAQKIGDKLFDKEALQKFASGRAAALGIKATTNIKNDIGQTALDHDLLPIFGGSQKMADRIQTAKQNVWNSKISPALQDIQGGLGKEGTQTENLLNNAGDLFNNFKDEVANRPDALQIVKKVEGELEPYFDHIQDSGTNVAKLNEIKQGLQAQEEAAYNVRANGQREPTPESDFYMKLGTLVKEHIEGLGNQVKPGLGDQLASGNGEYGNLITAGKSVHKLINKDADKALITPMELGEAVLSPHIGGPAAMVQAGTRLATGNPISRTVNKVAARGANWLANVGKEPNIVLDTSKSLYNASAEALNGFGQTLMSTPEGQNTGKALMTALKNNDTTAKNAVLFSIMQQPKLRKLIHGESADQTTDQK